jgi:hypothetical protein
MELLTTIQRVCDLPVTTLAATYSQRPALITIYQPVTKRASHVVATSRPQNPLFKLTFGGCGEDNGNGISGTYEIDRKFDPHRPYQLFPFLLCEFRRQVSADGVGPYGCFTCG